MFFVNTKYKTPSKNSNACDIDYLEKLEVPNP